MDLKSLFPISYKNSLLVALVIYIAVAIVAGLIIFLAGTLTGWIPVVGRIISWGLRIVSILVEAYVIVGIIVKILLALNVIK